MNDIELLFKGLKQKDNTFKNMDMSYIFTTENIKGYIPDLTDKDILTVTSSGDHYFNALVKGAKNVDLFDINSLTIHMLKLKKAAVENLDLDVFLNFFNTIDKENFFRYDIYLKFSKYLDKETYLYWNYIYELADFNNSNIYKSGLFYKLNYSSFDMNKINEYLEESNYLKLKKRLSDIRNINFINSDIFDLDNKLDKNYDTIFLSNINEYHDKNYIKIIEKLNQYLKQYGTNFAAYLYNYEVNPQNIFYTDLASKNKNLYSQIITGTDSYFMESKFKDKILIYSKG